MTVHLRPTLATLPGYVPGRTVAGAIKLASVFAFAAGILIALSPIPWYIRIPVSFLPLLAVTPLVKAWHRRR